MRRQAPADRLHTLEIPLATISLILPSACIAEVAPVIALTPVPFSPSWLLGVIGWRTLAVPVLSFESLLAGRRVPANSTSKIVVLYPLAGRGDWEFLGVVTASEPRPRTVDAATAVSATAADLPSSPYLAAGLRLENQVLAIPDLDALKKVLYPGS